MHKGHTIGGKIIFDTTKQQDQIRLRIKHI